MLASCLRRSGLCVVLALSLAPSARAQSEAPEPAILWYRSSEGCPDGASFLASVGERSSLVRLAEAGDRVDFVVNLAVSEEGARGRLERETERGTVAIREVEDASCERVAQVVALNLSLALDPAESRVRTTEEPTTNDAPDVLGSEKSSTGKETGLAAESEGHSEAEEEPPTGTENESSATAASAPPPDTAARKKTSTKTAGSSRWRVGLQGGIQSGITPGLLARGALFVEARGLFASLPDLTFRAAGVGAAGSADTDLGAIQQTLWAGRFEVCPFAFGGEKLSLSPCAAGELGRIRAAGPLSDAALWAAAGASVRGVWEFARPWALEAEVGANIPLNQYEILAGSETLYASASLGILALLGASFAF